MQNQLCRGYWEDQWPQTLHIWFWWTITSEAPRRKSAINSSVRRLMKVALQTTYPSCSCHKNMNKAVWNFNNCWTVYVAVAANGGHSENLQYLCPSSSLHPHLITNTPALFTATNILLVKTTLETLRNGELSWLKQRNFVSFTAKHGIQTRSSDENSVCPSVRHTRALWQKGRKICPDVYTIRKII